MCMNFGVEMGVRSLISGLCNLRVDGEAQAQGWGQGADGAL